MNDDGTGPVAVKKPLGQKAYGSIPHLLGSRRGPADRGVNEGQQRICTERARDRHDVIIVQEKLDGGCCAVAKVDGVIHAMSRAGYLARTSPYVQHHIFADWVDENYSLFDALLWDGDRVVGEWLAQAHGTRYRLPHGPFVAFDIMRGTGRATHDEVAHRVGVAGLPLPTTLFKGSGPTASVSVEAALAKIKGGGFHGALDPVEGAVWRVERNGAVDFLAKYVVADKVDGCYLPEITGCEPVWNWRPQEAAA